MEKEKLKSGFRKCLVCKTRFEPKSNTHWVCSVECAKVKGNEAVEKKKKQLLKSEWTKEKIEIKIYTDSKKYKNELQKWLNKLARMIDAKFEYTCIDCDRNYGKQTDGAHFHSRGANSSLRYHLDNIHSARSECNQYSSTHKEGYRKGLEKRYGKEYLELVEGLPLQFKEIKLNNREVYDKLMIVRKLIRDFDTFKFENSLAARTMFNKLIGIYGS